MNKSFSSLLLTNPDYAFGGVTKFLGEVSTDHKLAITNLNVIESNLVAFRKSLKSLMIDATNAYYVLDQIDYALKRVHQHLADSHNSGLSDKDASVFVTFSNILYKELAVIANDIDSQLQE